MNGGIGECLGYMFLIFFFKIKFLDFMKFAKVLFALHYYRIL